MSSRVELTIGETVLAVDLEAGQVRRVASTGPQETELPADPDAVTAHVEAVKLADQVAWKPESEEP